MATAKKKKAASKKSVKAFLQFTASGGFADDVYVHVGGKVTTDDEKCYECGQQRKTSIVSNADETIDLCETALSALGVDVDEPGIYELTVTVGKKLA